MGGEGGPPACHVLESPFKSCYQSLLTMLRLFRNVTPIASTMTIRAESVGRPAVLRCFIIISVFKYLHANFAILLEMTELKVDNGPL